MTKMIEDNGDEDVDEYDDNNEEYDDDDGADGEEDVHKVSGHLSANGQARQSDQTSFSCACCCLQLANN